MQRLTKKNCGDSVSLDELKRIQLDILVELVRFCNQNHIVYYLSGGTLLGAVRHQGFIPWDDDIDVNIPRPECERLQKLSKGKIGPYVLQFPSADSPYHSESWRLYDTKYVIESFLGGTTKKPVYYAVFIDIFPIEGLPDSYKRCVWHYRKMVFLRKMMNSSLRSDWGGRNLPAKCFHFFMSPFTKAVGYKRWYNWMQRTARKYSYEDAAYIGVMTAPVHTIEERLCKSEYEPVRTVTFEQRKLNAPGNYETYLTQLYGDYMKMPPKEKQVSHHAFSIYKYKV